MWLLGDSASPSEVQNKPNPLCDRRHRLLVDVAQRPDEAYAGDAADLLTDNETVFGETVPFRRRDLHPGGEPDVVCRDGDNPDKFRPAVVEFVSGDGKARARACLLVPPVRIQIC